MSSDPTQPPPTSTQQSIPTPASEPPTPHFPGWYPPTPSTEPADGFSGSTGLGGTGDDELPDYVKGNVAVGEKPQRFEHGQGGILDEAGRKLAGGGAVAATETGALATGEKEEIHGDGDRTPKDTPGTPQGETVPTLEEKDGEEKKKKGVLGKSKAAVGGALAGAAAAVGLDKAKEKKEAKETTREAPAPTTASEPTTTREAPSANAAPTNGTSASTAERSVPDSTSQPAEIAAPITNLANEQEQKEKHTGVLGGAPVVAALGLDRGRERDPASDGTQTKGLPDSTSTSTGETTQQPSAIAAPITQLADETSTGAPVIANQDKGKGKAVDPVDEKKEDESNKGLLAGAAATAGAAAVGTASYLGLKNDDQTTTSEAQQEITPKPDNGLPLPATHTQQGYDQAGVGAVGAIPPQQPSVPSQVGDTTTKTTIAIGDAPSPPPVSQDPNTTTSASHTRIENVRAGAVDPNSGAYKHGRAILHYGEPGTETDTGHSARPGVIASESFASDFPGGPVRRTTNDTLATNLTTGSIGEDTTNGSTIALAGTPAAEKTLAEAEAEAPPAAGTVGAAENAKQRNLKKDELEGGAALTAAATTRKLSRKRKSVSGKRDENLERELEQKEREAEAEKVRKRDEMFASMAGKDPTANETPKKSSFFSRHKNSPSNASATAPTSSSPPPPAPAPRDTAEIAHAHDRDASSESPSGKKRHSTLVRKSHAKNSSLGGHDSPNGHDVAFPADATSEGDRARSPSDGGLTDGEGNTSRPSRRHSTLRRKRDVESGAFDHHQHQAGQSERETSPPASPSADGSTAVAPSEAGTQGTLSGKKEKKRKSGIFSRIFSKDHKKDKEAEREKSANA